MLVCAAVLAYGEHERFQKSKKFKNWTTELYIVRRVLNEAHA